MGRRRKRGKSNRTGAAKTARPQPPKDLESRLRAFNAAFSEKFEVMLELEDGNPQEAHDLWFDVVATFRKGCEGGGWTHPLRRLRTLRPYRFHRLYRILLETPRAITRDEFAASRGEDRKCLHSVVHNLIVSVLNERIHYRRKRHSAYDALPGTCFSEDTDEERSLRDVEILLDADDLITRFGRPEHIAARERGGVREIENVLRSVSTALSEEMFGPIRRHTTIQPRHVATWTPSGPAIATLPGFKYRGY